MFAASLRRLQVKVSKKKQKQTMSLADFNAGGPSATPTRAAGSAYRAPVGRSGGDDNFVLPTGPRAREDEEAAMGGALAFWWRTYAASLGSAAEASNPPISSASIWASKL